MTNPLNALPEPSEATMHVLHDQLVTKAAAMGQLDLAYRIIDSPIGPLLLARTPLGLVRVAFDAEDHASVLERLAAQISPRILAASHQLDEEARQLTEYFEGRRHQLDLTLDFSLSKGFRREVLHHLCRIPYASTESYGQVASSLGRPTAVRATGTACATNPLPIVVPCHRVVRSDGSLGGYLAGLAAKQTLLDLERHGAGR